METIDRFVAVGTTKFVILPIVEPATPHEWVEHLEQVAPTGARPPDLSKSIRDATRGGRGEA